MSQRTTWIDRVSHKLLHYAAARAPDALSARLEEEWLADMAVRPPGSSRLRFAIGCCWATRVIALEHQPSARIVGAVMEAKLAPVDAQYSLSYFSRRSSAFFLVVMLHVALFYVLVAKLSHTQVTVPPSDITVRPVDDVIAKKPPQLPRLDIGKLVVTPIPPEFPRTDIGPISDPQVDRVEPPPVIVGEWLPPQSPAHIVQRLPGGPGTGFPSADDFFPDAAKRLGEQGSGVVQVCVDAKGRLTSVPTMGQSTGSVRLDAGALKLAKAGSGHYRASTEDGQPVNSCYAFRIRFQFKN